MRRNKGIFSHHACRRLRPAALLLVQFLRIAVVIWHEKALILGLSARFNHENVVLSFLKPLFEVLSAALSVLYMTLFFFLNHVKLHAQQGKFVLDGLEGLSIEWLLAYQRRLPLPGLFLFLLAVDAYLSTFF